MDGHRLRNYEWLGDLALLGHPTYVADEDNTRDILHGGFIAAELRNVGLLALKTPNKGLGAQNFRSTNRVFHRLTAARRQMAMPLVGVLTEPLVAVSRIDANEI